MTLKINPHQTLPATLILASTLLLCLFSTAPAKIRMTTPAQFFPQEFRHGVTKSAIQAFESRLLPYLQARLKGAKFVKSLPAAELPHEGDFLALAKVWSGLDKSFLTVYLAAVSTNPQGYDSCLSPGGHYVIYYTTNPDSADAVDPTDTIGFGPDSTNWRTKTSGPNGIPDYIDQVAFSCDSAWSMEVKRFGFHHPTSMAANGGPSSRYHFFCTEVGDGYYGQTFPDQPFPDSAIGFFAHCEVRGNWNDSEWILDDSTLNYMAHPENAAHVTCVHENFHGIQFSMLWNNAEFDYFPLGWIEGTAVMMEHLGFDYIKDYIQYAEGFFTAPTEMPFFVDQDASILYSNSLLTIYLYEKAPPSPRIDFPKSMFFNNFNYTNGIPFDTNLRAVSADSTFKTTWVGLLNRFHTGSYFTGPRADTSKFDLDAGIMPYWTTSPDSSAPSYSITKAVNPYAMQVFDYQPVAAPFDTLTIRLSCNDSGATVPTPRWAASCIVLGTGLPDSIIAIPLDTFGNGTCVISGFRSRTGVIVIPTNGDPIVTGSATVSFQAGAPGIPAAPTLAGPVSSTGGLGSSVTLSWNTSPGAASYSVQVATTSSFTNFYRSIPGIAALSTTVTGLSPNAKYYWRVDAADISGTSGWSSAWSFTTFTPLTIFPNPPHLSGSSNPIPNNFIRFEGSGIQSVCIYSLDGQLVTNSATGESSAFAKLADGLQWQLKNSKGRSVAPGYYRAEVAQKDTLAGISSTTVHKLLVFP
jgi:hypothetical protein